LVEYVIQHVSRLTAGSLRVPLNVAINFGAAFEDKRTAKLEHEQELGAVGSSVDPIDVVATGKGTELQ
jgi:hypothetical protein